MAGPIRGTVGQCPTHCKQVLWCSGAAAANVASNGLLCCLLLAGYMLVSVSVNISYFKLFC